MLESGPGNVRWLDKDHKVNIPTISPMLIFVCSFRKATCRPVKWGLIATWERPIREAPNLVPNPRWKSDGRVLSGVGKAAYSLLTQLTHSQGGFFKDRWHPYDGAPSKLFGGAPFFQEMDKDMFAYGPNSWDVYTLRNYKL